MLASLGWLFDFLHPGPFQILLCEQHCYQVFLYLTIEHAVPLRTTEHVRSLQEHADNVHCIHVGALVFEESGEVALHFICDGDDGGIRYNDGFVNANGKQRREREQVFSVDLGYVLILTLEEVSGAGGLGENVSMYWHPTHR